MERTMNTIKRGNSRVLAVLLALVMLLSTGVVALAEDYGMQGGNHKLQMLNPSDITVNSASATDYDNTINSKVALNEGVASFQFKMDAFGGQIKNAGEGNYVSAMQSKVNGVVTLTDSNGGAVSGAQLTVTAVDTTAITFDLDISGLEGNTSYVLTFPSSFTTGGGNWVIGANIKFNFTTEGAQPTEVPYGPQGGYDATVDTGISLYMFEPAADTIKAYQLANGDYWNVISSEIDAEAASFTFKIGGGGGTNGRAFDFDNKVAVYSDKELTTKVGTVSIATSAKTASSPRRGTVYELTATGLEANKTYYLKFQDAVSVNANAGLTTLTKNIIFEFTTKAATPATVAVTGVALDKTELTMDEGASDTLTATVSPEDATNKNITWSSSDEAVATVDAEGKVTAVKAGSATITVTTEDGEKTATCSVTVNHVEEVLPAKAATCTETGLTEGKKCSVCGEILTAQEEIPALGHDVKDGKCTRCGEEVAFKKVNGQWGTFCGEQNVPFTGFMPYNGKLWYVLDGKTDFNITGLIKDPATKDTVYKVVGNEVKPGPTLAKNDKGWWYVDETGKVDYTYTGFAPYNGKLWYVTGGKVKFNVTGLIKDPKTGNFYKVVGNEVKPGPGTAKNDKGVFYIDKDGKVDFSYNGLVTNDKGTWVVQYGQIYFTYNGKYTYQGKTYNVKNSQVIS